jgi:hypothetical protein
MPLVLLPEQNRYLARQHSQQGPITEEGAKVAVLDDLRGMAAEDFVYLSRSIGETSAMQMGTGDGFTSVYRGRIRQATDGGWVFSAFTGQNGLVGLVLGQIDQGWNSTPTTAGNATVTIIRPVMQFMDPSTQMGVTLVESIVLSEAIPTAFVQ